MTNFAELQEEIEQLYGLSLISQRVCEKFTAFLSAGTPPKEQGCRITTRANSSPRTAQ